MDLCSAGALQALCLWASFCSKEGLGWDFESSCELGGEEKEGVMLLDKCLRGVGRGLLG